MAVFTNIATLSYNGVTTNSNTVTGEILESVSATKTAVVPEYSSDSDVAFVVSLVNSSSAAVNGLTVTDDLGGYALSGDPTQHSTTSSRGKRKANKLVMRSIAYFLNGC